MKRYKWSVGYLTVSLLIPFLSFHHFNFAAETEIKNNQFEIIEFYSELSRVHPHEAQYFYVLGHSYYQMHAWEYSIDALRQSLALQPNNVDARLILAYAYLKRKRDPEDIKTSERLFQEVLIEFPNYLDAKEGLKKADAVLKKTSEHYYELGQSHYKAQEWDLAIEAFEHTLALQPNNVDARLILAYAYLKRKRDPEDIKTSERLFQEVLVQDPEYTDAKEGLKQAHAALKPNLLPINDGKQESEEKKYELNLEKQHTECHLQLAKQFSKEGFHCKAIEIYQELADQFPDNAEYLYLIGIEYAKMQYRCEAIDYFNQALNLKPDYSDVLIALGNQTLFFKEFCYSLELFTKAVKLAPNDPAGWVGLARTEALLSRFEDAESAFDKALLLGPQDPDLWEPYATFLKARRRYIESKSAYRYLSYLTHDFQTYRPSLLKVSAYTNPTFFANGGSTKEKEKDLFTHKWVASLLYNYAEAGIYYPINERFRISARQGWLDIKQSNLASHTTLYDIKFLHAGLGMEYFYDPNWTVTAKGNVVWVSDNDSHATLPTKRGVKFEPSLIFRYSDYRDTVSFGEFTDTWYFKNFKRNNVSAFVREYLFVNYQHDFGEHRLIGADAAWGWFQDPIYNQEQDLNAWIQAAVPYLEDLLTVRYHCEYRQFRKETTGYYSFQYQLTHWLRLNLTKQWLFGGRCEFLYWHGWRTTRGKNPQEQITVGPQQALLPVVTVNDQIDSVTLTVGYTPTPCFDFFILGNYWHDSFDYTVWTGKFVLEWSF